MKILTLLENTSACDSLGCEHGLSLYIQTEKHRLLVDTGASDLTWANAERLGIDLSRIDTVVLSHGHYDHSGGLIGLSPLAPHARIYMQRTAPNRYVHQDRYIGIDPAIARLPNVCLIDTMLVIDDELTLFSDIRGQRLRPASNIGLSEIVDGRPVQDIFRHELCLSVVSGGVHALFSGCAHNGILNILDRYRECFGREPDLVVSGFHMMKKTAYTPDEVRDIRLTAEALAGLPTRFFTGHCTGDAAYELMKPILGDRLHRMRSGVRIL